MTSDRWSADEWRAYMDTMPDEFELRPDLLPGISAVLVAPYSYVPEPPGYVTVKAHGLEMQTVGQLRAVARLYPQPKPSNANDAPSVEELSLLLERVLAPLREACTWNKLRHIALVNLMTRDDPDFYVRYIDELHAIAKTDFRPTYDMLLPTTGAGPEVFDAMYPGWRDETAARLSAMLGPERTAQVRASWADFEATMELQRD